MDVCCHLLFSVPFYFCFNVVIYQGQCDCRDNVQGLECTECKDGYYNLQGSNPSGCDSCDCNLDGVIGGLKICDKVTGQCPCKLYVTGRRCTSCKAGFYGLAGSKVFGCTGVLVVNIWARLFESRLTLILD